MDRGDLETSPFGLLLEPAMLLAVPVIALVLAGKPSPPPAASGVAFNTSQGSYMVR